jgi:hypothetical protein
MLARGLAKAGLTLVAVLGWALWCLVTGTQWNAVPDGVAFIIVAAVAVDVWVKTTSARGRS